MDPRCSVFLVPTCRLLELFLKKVGYESWSCRVCAGSPGSAAGFAPGSYFSIFQEKLHLGRFIARAL